MSIFVKISANSYNVFLPHSIMFNLDKVKGILFDYGGTIDSNGMHWAEVIWMAYEALKVPVSKAVFRDAYVHGERTLGKNPIVKPHHTFLDMLRLKSDLQIQWLKERAFIRRGDYPGVTGTISGLVLRIRPEGNR